jgi:hypothetical protein
MPTVNEKDQRGSTLSVSGLMFPSTSACFRDGSHFEALGVTLVALVGRFDLAFRVAACSLTGWIADLRVVRHVCKAEREKSSDSKVVLG